MDRSQTGRDLPKAFSLQDLWGDSWRMFIQTLLGLFGAKMQGTEGGGKVRRRRCPSPPLGEMLGRGSAPHPARPPDRAEMGAGMLQGR